MGSGAVSRRLYSHYTDVAFLCLQSCFLLRIRGSDPSFSCGGWRTRAGDVQPLELRRLALWRLVGLDYQQLLSTNFLPELQEPVLWVHRITTGSHVFCLLKMNREKNEKVYTLFGWIIRLSNLLWFIEIKRVIVLFWKAIRLLQRQSLKLIFERKNRDKKMQKIWKKSFLKAFLCWKSDVWII